jgi:hypothetical protein
VVRAYEYRSVEPARLAALAERLTSLEERILGSGHGVTRAGVAGFWMMGPDTHA